MSVRTFSLLCTFIFLSMQLLPTLSEARVFLKKPTSAVVVGTVYCDTCFHKDFSSSSHFISGASVAVECADNKQDSRSSLDKVFREVARTDEHGEFRVHLPMSVSKHVKKIKGCSVKQINSSEPYCSVASSASSSSIHLKSRKDGAHIFSAGFFTFKPLSRPKLCAQKPAVIRHRFKTSSISDPNDPSFFPPVQDLPPMGQTILPPLPELPPLPPLPTRPSLSGVVNVNLPGGPKEEKIAGPDIFNPIPLPQNPLLPPPSLFPPFPNPFQPPPSVIPPVLPTPPSSIFPPVFPSPPTSVFPPILPSPSANPPAFQFPPLPGFTPSSPPPGAPTLPISIPPFPFQPAPGFPGIPPRPH